MPPAVNQEINVNINALVKRVQDVKDFVAIIRSLREQRGPVIIDDKISKNAKSSIGDVQQLKTSIDQLAVAIQKLDDQKVGRLAHTFQLLSNVSNVLGHVKQTVEGVQFLFDLADKAPNAGERISGLGSKLRGAATGVRSFFSAAKEKIGDGIAKAKEAVGGLVSKLPNLISSGSSAAGTLATVGAAGLGTALALGPLVLIVLALVAALAALIAVPAVGSFLFNLANEASEVGSEFHDLSTETGVAAETLSGLAPAIRQSGLEMNEVGSMIGKFNKLIGQANEGSKEATATLKKFGVEPQEALKNSEAALAKVFKRINELPTGTEKAIAAQQAFGKSGAAMVKVIESTNGNLEESIKKAKELGVVLSDEAARAADEFGDQLDEAKIRVHSFGLAIGRTLIPILLQLLRIFNHEMPAAGGSFQFVMGAIGSAVQHVVNQVIVAIAALKTLAALPSALGVLIASGSFAGAFDIILGRFKQELGTLLRVAHEPATGGGSTGTSLDTNKGGGGKGSTAGTPADTFGARLSLRQALADQEFNLEKDLIDRLTTANQDALDKRKISIEEFFSTQEDLRNRLIEAEAKHLKGQVELERDRARNEIKKIEADKDQSRAQKDAAQQNVLNEYLARAAELQERITKLQRDQADIAPDIAAGTKEQTEALRKQLDTINDEIDEFNGRTSKIEIGQILDRLNPILENLKRNFGETSIEAQLLQSYIDALVGSAKAKQLDALIEVRKQQGNIEILNVETQLAQRVITQREAREQIREIQIRYLREQLQILKNELSLETSARNQLQIKQRIAETEKQIAETQNEIDQTAATINESLKGAFTDFFASLADGTKNFKQAIADLGRFILQMFARLAAARLVEGLFGKVLGDEAGQGGIGGILSGIFGGKKAAGDMMSARPGGQLIQVAEAGFDELVVTTDPRYARRTSSLLGAFMERTGILPNFAKFGAGGFARSVGNRLASIPRLAAGAFVPAPVPAFAEAGGGAGTLNAKFVSVYDPRHVHDAMRSDGGEEVFLNFISRNTELIKRTLKLR